MIAHTDQTTEPRGPMAYAYGRISHKSQEDKESVPAQEKRSRWYYDGVLEAKGIGWGGFFHDGHHLSAYRRPFPKRPAGRKIIAAMQPGDHIIFDKVDRVWRSVEDFVVLLKWFQVRQISVHFVNYMGASFQVDKPMGRFILTMMVAAAEMSSGETSDRIKAERRVKRSEGRWDGRQVPFACKVLGAKGSKNRRLVWDEPKLALLAKVVALDEEGKSDDRIAVILEQEACAAEGRPFRGSINHPERFWTTGKIKKLLDKRALLTVAPHTDPNGINFNELYGRNRSQPSMLVKELID